MEHCWWERDEKLMVKYQTLWFGRQMGGGGWSQAPGIFAGHSRYLRQPRKVCGTFVPARTVVRSHLPCIIPVTAQVVWVAFVCLIIGVET